MAGPCQASGGMLHAVAPGGAQAKGVALRRSVTARGGDCLGTFSFLTTFARIREGAFLLFFIEQCYYFEDVFFYFRLALSI